MSDTPRTDAVWAKAPRHIPGWQIPAWEESIGLELRVTQLKRENAELRMTLKAEADAVTRQGATIRRLERENAELRKDKERLDWLEEDTPDVTHRTQEGWCVVSEVGIASLYETCRAAIDAAREDKP